MTPRPVPRVLIADRSVVVIDRLAATINDVAQVIGRATTASDALKVIRVHQPHITVFDVAIGDGIQLLRQVKRLRPPVITVVLTHSAEETTRQYCQRLGAEYFLDKLREFHRVREIVIAVGKQLGRMTPEPPTPQ